MRQEIIGDELDLISGGAFNFYQKDGSDLVYIDGIGTYYCSKEAGNWIASNAVKCNDMELLVKQAIDDGLFWK